MRMNLPTSRILLTGGAGFLGRAVVERLRARGVTDIFIPRRRDYDLTHEADVERVYRDARPDVVIHLAAEVGGIGANQANPGRIGEHREDLNSEFNELAVGIDAPNFLICMHTQIIA